jgi:hypothetical protein
MPEKSQYGIGISTVFQMPQTATPLYFFHDASLSAYKLEPDNEKLSIQLLFYLHRHLMSDNVE